MIIQRPIQQLIQKPNTKGYYNSGSNGGGGEPVTAKSVIFDIVDDYGNANAGIRSVEFKSGGTLIEMLLANGDFEGYHSSYLDAVYHARYVFDTSKSKIGSVTGSNGWLGSGSGSHRLIIVFTDPQSFDEIVINNFHNNGANTDASVKRVAITVSDDVFTNTTYNAAIPNSTVLNSIAAWPEHIVANTADDQTVWTWNDRYLDVITAKSVVFDVLNSWGQASLGMRSIEFYSGVMLLSLTGSDFTAYSATQWDTGTLPGFAFDTSLSKTGGYPNNSWLSANGASTNQRLIIVFNTEQSFNSIVVNNFHISGGTATYGARITSITSSLDAITDTTYNAAIANSTALTVSEELAMHAVGDTVDDVEAWTNVPVIIPPDIVWDTTVIPGTDVAWENVTSVTAAVGRLHAAATGSWTGHANFGSIPDGVDFELSCIANSYEQIIGVTAGVGVSTSNLDYCLYPKTTGGGGIYVWEKDGLKNSSGAAYVYGVDILSIRRIGTVVTYRKNGDIIYTSLVSSPGVTLYCEVWLNDSAGDISDITLSY